MIERLSADWKNQTPVDQMWKKINEIIDWINEIEKDNNKLLRELDNQSPESMSRNVPKEQTKGCGKFVKTPDMTSICGDISFANKIILCEDCKKGEMK